MTEQAEVKVPNPDEVSAAAAAWAKAKKVLDRAKDAESEARKLMVATAFPNGLKEGTNTYDLPGKWKLKVSGVIDRKVDEPSIVPIMERLKERFPNRDFSGLIRYKPELIVAEYKKLVAADPKAAKLFDNILIIRGTDQTSPQPKIEEAKR